jgi:endogenous inhibitor of DNA gyrase (YacG/DUF329 family)
MQNQTPSTTKFRRLVRGQCQYCGRTFFTDKHDGRPRLFCDKRCRQADFRRSRYLTSKNDETSRKNQTRIQLPSA